MTLNELHDLRTDATAIARTGGKEGHYAGEVVKAIDAAKIRRELKDMERTREVKRSSRKRSGISQVAIAGYTNAGKSSLLNRLTSAGVLAEDRLFATLDPTTRRLSLPGGEPVLLTDTVGFVRRLPHGLVESFKSTLEACQYTYELLRGAWEDDEVYYVLVQIWDANRLIGHDRRPIPTPEGEHFLRNILATRPTLRASYPAHSCHPYSWASRGLRPRCLARCRVPSRRLVGPCVVRIAF